ncbi:MAG: 50S ribosomal protein L17 [Bacteroidetes bacterium MED-G20]|nr:MAG: 50S ribosomal protein L17 [Bacteroidetes bacterium MED-G20]
MRHGKKTNHLSRKTAHRSALLSNMACSLIEHKRINTTLAKAKALRKYVEPLITKSKQDTTHNRRIVFSYLKNKDASSVLFRDVAPKINDRPGGYTRIIKLNNRLGDNAEMAMIELVDFNDLLTKDQTKKKKTRRRGGKKTSTAASKPAESNDVIEDVEIIEESPEFLKDENPPQEDVKMDTTKAEPENSEEKNDDDKSAPPPKEGDKK